MCGIVGFFGNTDRDQSLDILRRMLTKIRHRGPDESGVYLAEGIALGSVRLSIQDIKSGGMPISNAEGSLWIVYNGEIFNFIELREELVQKGHVFKTTGDTEVILHLYQEYGAAFLKKVIGQFAIAIWDKTKRELFLARDRVGIRPLYFTNFKETFIFVSEMKALLEFPGFEFDISHKSLAQYFTFWTSLSPDTIFEDIYEVPPGYYMIVRHDGIRKVKYWEVPIIREKDQSQVSLDNAMEEFDVLFTDAIKLRLRADVPVAAYLSGGLDSTITTSYIQKVIGDKLNTFSVGFDNSEFDESDYQQLAVNYFGTKHSSIKISNDDIANYFREIIWHTEVPVLRTSPVPMYALSKNVRQNNIKVVITGEGADEIFGGYNIFKEAKIRQFWAKDIHSKYRPLLLKKLYPYLPSLSSANQTALKLFFGYKLTEIDSPIYSHLLRWNNTSRIKNYFSAEVKSNIKNYEPITDYLAAIGENLSGADYLTKASKIEMDLFLSGYLLSSQGDRMAMANSVEGRYPFLDHRIIEFGMKLKSNYKLNGLNEKYILKKLMNGKIPDPILKRPKQAYRAPIKNAVYGIKRPDYINNIMSENSIGSFGLFDQVNVKHLLNKILEDKQVSEIDNMALVGILSTQLIYDLFVKKSRGKLNKNEIIQLDKQIID